MSPRLLRSLCIFAAGFVLLIGGLAAVTLWRDSTPTTGSTVATGTPAIGGPFTLVDHTGRTVTDANYRGKLLLIFFGFTSCPDVCPTTLQKVASALDVLGKDADRVQPLFITVDPERDTPEVVADYVKLFHLRIVGLTGSPAQVAAAAKAYRVYYAKRETGDGSYLMDHIAITYLMGPDGQFLTHFSHDTPAEKMVETVRRHLAQKS